MERRDYSRFKCGADLQRCMTSDDEELLLKGVIESSAPILSYRLFFAVLLPPNIPPKSSEKTFFFSIDNKLVYENFFDDFGPLNIAMVYRYCSMLNEMLEDTSLQSKKIVHYTINNTAKLLNAAYLVGSYGIIYLHYTAKSIMRTLAPTMKKYLGAKFCDASQNDTYYLTLYDCFSAVAKAHNKGFFLFNDFNLTHYEHFECVENGDINWIVPGKFLAFCGPQSEAGNGKCAHKPETYNGYFNRFNVTAIIRLNKKKYDAKSFTDNGFNHYELYFIDGGTPSDSILRRFLAICEEEKGAVAVHCKAGLGRTGSLIGAYLIKHYGFSALEAIAWLRICRPGSVIGQQQTWLQSKESMLTTEGNTFRRLNPDFTPDKHVTGIYSNAFYPRNGEVDDNLVLRDNDLYLRYERLNKQVNPKRMVELNLKMEPTNRDKENREKILVKVKHVEEKPIVTKQNMELQVEVHADYQAKDAERYGEGESTTMNLSWESDSADEVPATISDVKNNVINNNNLPNNDQSNCSNNVFGNMRQRSKSVGVRTTATRQVAEVLPCLRKSVDVVAQQRRASGSNSQGDNLNKIKATRRRRLSNLSEDSLENPRTGCSYSQGINRPSQGPLEATVTDISNGNTEKVAGHDANTLTRPLSSGLLEAFTISSSVERFKWHEPENNNDSSRGGDVNKNVKPSVAQTVEVQFETDTGDGRLVVPEASSTDEGGGPDEIVEESICDGASVVIISNVINTYPGTAPAIAETSNQSRQLNQQQRHQQQDRQHHQQSLLVSPAPVKGPAHKEVGPQGDVQVECGASSLTYGMLYPGQQIPVYRKGRSLSMAARDQIRPESQEIGRLTNKRTTTLRTGADRLTICPGAPTHSKPLLQQPDRVKYQPSGNSSGKDTSKQRASVRSNRKYGTDNQHYRLRSRIPSAVSRPAATRHLSLDSRPLGDSLRLAPRDQPPQQQQFQQSQVVRRTVHPEGHSVIRPAATIVSTVVRGTGGDTMGTTTTTGPIAAPTGPCDTACDQNGNNTTGVADKRCKRTRSTHKREIEKNKEKMRKVRLKQSLKENSTENEHECKPMMVLVKKLTLRDLMEANGPVPDTSNE